MGHERDRRFGRTQQVAALLTMVVAMLLAVAPAATSAQDNPAPAADVGAAALLDLLPANAQMVVLVPNLNQFSRDLSKLNTAVNMSAPVLGDALGEFKRSMGMNKGVNDDGAMAMAVLDIVKAQQGEQPMLMFVPVSSYADFVSNYGTDQVDGVVELNLPTGHVAHAKQVGSYAVLTPQLEVLQAYQAGNTGEAYRTLAGKLGSQYMDGSDLAMLIDVNALAPTLQPMLDEGLAQGQQQLNAAPVPNAAMARAMLAIYGDAAKAVLSDTNSAIIAMDVDDAGLGMTFAAQFKPNSTLAKMFDNGGGGKESLKQLPNQQFLIASAMDFRGIAVDQIMDKVVARLQDPAVGWFGELIQGLAPMVKTSKSFAQVYYVPPQIGFNASMFNGVTVIDAGQGEQFRDAYRAYVAKLDQMRVDLGPMPGPDGRLDPNAPSAVMTFNSQYTENALQVDGVAVDQFAVSYTLPPQMVQQMGQAAGMMMMMGGTNQTGYLAIKDQYAIITTTPDAQLVKSTLASLKAGDGLAAQPTINQIDEHLTPDPSFVSYVSIAGIGQMVNQVMMMFGGNNGQPMFEVPADLPPVGFSVTIQESGVAKRLFVPMPVITFVSNTSQTMMMQMQQPPDNQINDGQNGPPPAPMR